MDCVTSVVPEIAPVGDAVAVTVIVEVPAGVPKLALPPQADSPVSDEISTTPAAHCISRRRLARRLLATPNRLRPSRMPLHQPIPVGVITGGWSTITLTLVESTGTLIGTEPVAVSESTAGTKLQRLHSRAVQCRRNSTAPRKIRSTK